MKEINGYILFSELKTTNSGFSKWGFAQRNGSRFFIKELIDPIYPVCADLLDSGVVARKRAICQQFEDRSKLLYHVINECSDGNLVHIEDFFRCDSHYYLVMEKIDAIGIDEVMAIPIGDRVRICKALVHCLGRLHQRGIVHADIKLDNILFRRLPSGKVTGKLIDFDNCFWEMQPPQPDEEIHGDLVYMAPETFMMMQTETGTIDRAIDVFALGLVFHQIFTGRLPAGAKLPGGRELALRYTINPNTAARVYQELEKEGLVEMRRGMGTYVTDSTERLTKLRTEMAREAVREYLDKTASLGYSREEAVTLITKEDESC